jgi:hypothetical protein
MGTLIDIAGDDLYESNNWSAGCGYWYGMGFLWDGRGDDTYKSSNWSQVCGAHFCIAALIDEEGDDKHILTGSYSDGLSFGHDYTVGLFLNRGGNDIYSCPGNGLGYAINMSQMYFFDTGGDDTYKTMGTKFNYGINRFDTYNPPPIGVYQLIFTNQISMFGDLSGEDKYLIEDYETKKITGDDPRMKNGDERFYPTPAEREELSNKRYYGIGIDFVNWYGPEIEFFRDKMKKRYEVFK